MIGCLHVDAQKLRVRIQYGVGPFAALWAVMIVAQIVISEGIAGPWIRLILTPAAIFIAFRIWDKGTDIIAAHNEGDDLLEPLDTIATESEISLANTSDITGGNLKGELHNAMATTESVNVPLQMSNKTLQSDDWQLLLAYDMAIKEEFEAIGSLGEEWKERFAELAVELPPAERDAGKLSQRVRHEYDVRWHLSDHKHINDALKRVAMLGREAEDEYRHIYAVVGDNMDVDEVHKTVARRYLGQEFQNEMFNWGIVALDDKYCLGDFQYETAEEAILHARRTTGRVLGSKSFKQKIKLVTDAGWHVDVFQPGTLSLSNGPDGYTQTIPED